MQMHCNCEYPYDTHHGVVTNRAKFDACTCSSFRGVKRNTQTDRIALYILDEKKVFHICLETKMIKLLCVNADL